MSGNPLVTIVRGRRPSRPPAPTVTDDGDWYRTDDGGLLVVLSGARPDAAAQLSRSVLRDPVTDVCERLDPITAPGTSSEPDAQGGYQVWISVTTTIDHQGPLAEFTVAETRSTMRHLPGFRSVTVFLGRDRPVVTEHVIWESEQHYAAMANTPDFAAHHLHPIAEVATDTTWQRAWPCPRD